MRCFHPYLAGFLLMQDLNRDLSLREADVREFRIQGGTPIYLVPILVFSRLLTIIWHTYIVHVSLGAAVCLDSNRLVLARAAPFSIVSLTLFNSRLLFLGRVVVRLAHRAH
jgi:hypothetical protein